jgi:hypothetical protein
MKRSLYGMQYLHDHRLFLDWPNHILAKVQNCGWVQRSKRSKACANRGRTIWDPRISVRCRNPFPTAVYHIGPDTFRRPIVARNQGEQRYLKSWI